MKLKPFVESVDWSATCHSETCLECGDLRIPTASNPSSNKAPEKYLGNEFVVLFKDATTTTERNSLSPKQTPGLGTKINTQIQPTTSTSEQYPGEEENQKVACHPSEFQCKSRIDDCVPHELLCDGYQDCEDGSDEFDCGCKPDQFRCVSGLCISASYRCDGINNCGDFSDEILGCTQPEFPATGHPEPINGNGSVAAYQETKPHVSTTSPKATLMDCTHFTECFNGGSCVMKNLQPVCDCRSGFVGKYCQFEECPLGNCKSASSGENGSNSEYSKTSTFVVLVMATFALLLLRFAL